MNDITEKFATNFIGNESLLSVPEPLKIDSGQGQPDDALLSSKRFMSDLFQFYGLQHMQRRTLLEQVNVSDGANLKWSKSPNLNPGNTHLLGADRICKAQLQYRCILNCYPINSKTILWGNSEIAPQRNKFPLDLDSLEYFFPPKPWSIHIT